MSNPFWEFCPKCDKFHPAGYCTKQPEQPAKIPNPWQDEREKLEARVRELEAGLDQACIAMHGHRHMKEAHLAARKVLVGRETNG